MKRANTSVYKNDVFKKLKLELRATDSESSDTESIWSVQSRETNQPVDTEDTSDSYIDDETLRKHKRQRKYFLSSSEESEIQEIADLGAAVASAVLDHNFDIGLHADSSEECSTSPTSNSDVDPGLPRSDYLDFETCQICKTDKKDISYPYCKDCYTFKKIYQPPRPKRRRRKKGIIEKSKSESGSVTVSDIASSQDSGCLSGSQGSIDSESLSSQKPSSSKADSYVDNMCEICYESPRDGLFEHQNTCHLYGCYRCAKKVWYATRACPLCRQKINKVVRLLQPDIRNQF